MINEIYFTLTKEDCPIGHETYPCLISLIGLIEDSSKPNENKNNQPNESNDVTDYSREMSEDSSDESTESFLEMEEEEIYDEESCVNNQIDVSRLWEFISNCSNKRLVPLLDNKYFYFSCYLNPVSRLLLKEEHLINSRIFFDSQVTFHSTTDNICFTSSNKPYSLLIAKKEMYQ